MKNPLLFIPFVLGTCIMISSWLPPIVSSKKANDKAVEKFRGVCWDGGYNIQLEHLKSLEPYAVNWISLTPFGYQQYYNSPEIMARRGQRGQESRENRFVNTAKLAKKIGIKTMLKPHIWLRHRENKWRSDIEMDSPKDWQQWFAQYEQFILHYAQLAEIHQMEALCIGTELYLCTTRHEKEWRNLIKKIRKIYSGQLTYAANFYKEYEEIQFWDALDFIGLQAYFPLTEELEPSQKALLKGWEPHLKDLKKFHKKWNKPIIFTEFGYRSSKDAAIHPWEWEQRGQIDSTQISAKTQAICYDALFNTFWQEDWIAGTFLWKWTSENYHSNSSTYRRRRSPSPFSFSPKKESLKILKKWYQKDL